MEPENTSLEKDLPTTNFGFWSHVSDFAVEYQLKISKDQDTAAQDLVVGALAITGS